MLRGESIWAQLFSEPDAGSDLASLRTTATPVRDGWVLHGQKVWTTWAHRAGHGLVLARTDSEAPKHRGLTMFAIDLRTAGITVRPMRQITGEAFFNEVFLDDVRVPPQAVVGEPGRGWDVAMTTLMHERTSVGARARRGSPVQPVVQLARRTGRRSDPVVRQQLAALVCREAVLGLLGRRVIEDLVHGREPGPEGSLAKLANARLGIDAAQLAPVIAGPAAAAWAGSDGRWAKAAAASFGPAIGGGTAEIMKNILAERVLGLPR
jgi:alkylation response protein AidB-like acyl-CoA dehydrogenase